MIAKFNRKSIGIRIQSQCESKCVITSFGDDVDLDIDKLIPCDTIIFDVPHKCYPCLDFVFL